MQRELVVKARDGDMDAYSDLVRLAHPRLFNVARLILRDSDRAQDAVQDALLLAWRHVRSLRNPDAWDAWLHRLTVRACYKLAKGGVGVARSRSTWSRIRPWLGCPMPRRTWPNASG